MDLLPIRAIFKNKIMKNNLAICIFRKFHHTTYHHIGGRNAICLAPPHRPRTDPDVLFSRIRFLGCIRIRAVLLSYPVQDQSLFFAVRLACVLQPYVSGTSFLCKLRVSVRSFPLWLAFPTSEYYA